jgi:transcription elongation factor Elf1
MKLKVIKNCPFCGHEPLIKSKKPTGKAKNGFVSIECEHCTVKPKVETHFKESEGNTFMVADIGNLTFDNIYNTAIRIWNSRDDKTCKIQIKPSKDNIAGKWITYCAKHKNAKYHRTRKQAENYLELHEREICKSGKPNEIKMRNRNNEAS